MPAQYAAMMHAVQNRAKLDKWRQEALADVESQYLNGKEEIRAYSDMYTVDAELLDLEGDLTTARDEIEAEYRKGMVDAADAAACYRFRALPRRSKVTRTAKEDHTRKQRAAEIARETLAQTSVINAEIERLKAELAATKEKLAAMEPKKGYATPALAMIRSK
jgi:hypothetical protein